MWSSKVSVSTFSGASSMSARRWSSIPLGSRLWKVARNLVRRLNSSITRNRIWAMLPTSMTRRSGVHVRILSAWNAVDAYAWATTTLVNSVATRHHIWTFSHFTTRMMTTGICWKRMMTVNTHGCRAPLVITSESEYSSVGSEKMYRESKDDSKQTSRLRNHVPNARTQIRRTIEPA